MEVTGKVKVIKETETFDSGFTKRDLIVLTQEQYPQYISIQFLKDKTSLLDKFKEGDSVSVGINLGGREWTSPKGEVRYFNSITGWKIDKVDQNTPDIPSVPPMEVNTGNNEDFEDLPF